MFETYKLTVIFPFKTYILPCFAFSCQALFDFFELRDIILIKSSLPRKKKKSSDINLY